LKVTNTSIYANLALGYSFEVDEIGDGIWNDGNAEFNYCTITHHGLGLFNLGDLVINNSIVAKNERDIRGGARGSFNLVGKKEDSGLADSTNIMGSLYSPLDPLLNAPEKNGGSTYSLAPLPGSPALDAANPADTLSFDQRGFVRPGGSRNDIGAVEYQAPVLPEAFISEELIAHEEVGDICIYPNAFDKSVTIDITTEKDEKLKIALFEVTSGKKVFEKDLQLDKGKSNSVLDLSTLSPGIYYAEVRNDGRGTLKKLRLMRK
jgi:hypothetical protein